MVRSPAPQARLFALTLLLACRGGDAPDDGGADDAGASFSDVEAVVSDVVPTVVTVTFANDGEGEGWVAFGPPGEAGWTATATATGAGRWTATLLGIPADTEGWFQVGVGDAADVVRTVRTGDAPGWVEGPETAEGDPTPGFLVVGLMGDLGHGAAILDARGRPVWWWEAPASLPGTLHTRARLDPDGGSVWFDSFGLLPPGEAGDGESALVHVALDGTAEEVVPLAYHHHDFLLHDDGTLAWLDVESRYVEGDGDIRGDVLKERAPDGTERAVWSSWDTFAYAPGATWTNPPGWWSLANHLEYVAAEDAYAVSLRNLDSVVVIARATGEVLRVVGTDPAATVVPDDPFDGQHGFDVLDDGLLVFDNGPTGEQSSRAARYVDGGATLAWTYEPGIYSFVMGDAQVLPDDRTLVVFSTEGQVHEVDADGRRVAAFAWDEGTTIGFAEWRSTLVR